MLCATLIWGVSFSAQKTAMEYLTPLVFTTMRSLAGAISLLPIILIADKSSGTPFSFFGRCETPAEKKTLLRGGFFCGIFLTGGLILQQWGLSMSTAGKTGFLTALYIIIVPVLGMLFFKRKTGIILWLAAMIALAGAYMLCSGGASGTLTTGDFLVIMCAFVYSLHILTIDHYAPGTDCLRMSCIQFITAALLAALLSLVIPGNPWSAEALHSACWLILYCGIFAGGAGFTLQMLAQKHLHPATAALLMSLESVFSVIGGWLILNEHLSGREMLGCAVIFLAVIIAQIPAGRPLPD